MTAVSTSPVITTRPSLETWQAWRSALPAVPAIADLHDPRGLKHAMRAALTEAQGGRCALCFGVGVVLVLDHDHETGFARGMSCRSCNDREGSCPPGADPVMDAYRANPPAAGAGWLWDRPNPRLPGRPRRAGRPSGPDRVPLTVRILATNDDRLTAAVGATGQNPQSIVDAALTAYFDTIGIP